jgi:hypothetical protein
MEDLADGLMDGGRDEWINGGKEIWREGRTD